MEKKSHACENTRVTDFGIQLGERTVRLLWEFKEGCMAQRQRSRFSPSSPEFVAYFFSRSFDCSALRAWIVSKALKPEKAE